MITIKIREAMEVYRRRTGARITYVEIAKLTGLSENTIESIGRKLNYNATLDTIDKLCTVLSVTPGELLEQIPDPPKTKRSGRKKRGS